MVFGWYGPFKASLVSSGETVDRQPTIFGRWTIRAPPGAFDERATAAAAGATAPM